MNCVPKLRNCWNTANDNTYCVLDIIQNRPRPKSVTAEVPNQGLICPDLKVGGVVGYYAMTRDGLGNSCFYPP